MQARQSAANRFGNQGGDYWLWDVLKLAVSSEQLTLTPRGCIIERVHQVFGRIKSPLTQTAQLRHLWRHHQTRKIHQSAWRPSLHQPILLRQLYTFCQPSNPQTLNQDPTQSLAPSVDSPYKGYSKQNKTASFGEIPPASQRFLQGDSD